MERKRFGLYVQSGLGRFVYAADGAWRSEKKADPKLLDLNRAKFAKANLQKKNAKPIKMMMVWV